VPSDIAAVIHSGRGMAMWMRKQLPEAEAELKLAIAEYRKVPGAGAKLAQLLFGLSAVHQAMGDQAGAQKYLREATAIAATEPSMRGYVQAEQNSRGAGAPAAGPATALVEGRFAQARDGYVAACSDDPGNHWNWYHLTCLEIYLGDDKSYRDAAKSMLERFGSTDISTVGERTAKVCLLTPTPVGEMAKLQALVDQALASKEDENLMPWFSLTKALAEYRAGQFEPCLKFLHQTETINGPPARATADLLRAMAHHRMGHPDQARSFLVQARERMDSKLAKPGVDRIEASENWLICHVLRREADQLIDHESSGGVKTPPPRGR
jgi:tetratricopeptide (TPR) repeat protein